MCFYFFRELLLWVYRRLYRLAPGFLMSTVFLGLQHWTFFSLCSLTLGHILASDVEEPELCQLLNAAMLQKKKQKGQRVWKGNMVSKSSGHSHESHANVFFLYWLMNSNHYTVKDVAVPLIALDLDRNLREEQQSWKQKVYISINTNCAVYSFETDHEIFVNRLATFFPHYALYIFSHFSLLWYGAANYPFVVAVRAALSPLPDRRPPCWKTTETTLLTCWVRPFNGLWNSILTI